MHLKSLLRQLRLLTLIVPSLVLLGCFGGGSGTAPTPPGTARGVLVNAPIEGADYATATQSGVTSNTGEFRYVPGEMVTFSVGGIVLGTVAGAPLVTPVELTGNVLNGPGLALAPNAATNQLVFLQSIDADQTTGGYATGITISPATRAAAQAQALDFNSPTFATDVMTVVTAIAPPGNMVVTNTEALDNFYDTYKSLGGSNTFSWPFPGYPAFPPTSAQLLTNGTFEIPDAFPGAIPGAPGWTTFESVFTKANVDQFNNFGPVSHDAGGTQFLTMFGPFQLNPNAAGAFQSVDAVPGAIYDASVWVMNWAPDELTNIGIFQLSFWDGPNATGNNLDTFEVTVDSVNTPLGQTISLSPQDGADISDWTQLSITQKTAPAGTVSAQVFLLHIQTNPVSGGSIFWDDASLIGPAVGSTSGFNTLVWSDEFARGTQLDLTKWTLDTGYGASGWGNNEWQEYTNSANNISIDDDPGDPTNGHLRISAQLDTANCPVPAVGVCGFQDGTITSAKITTNPAMMPNQGLAFKYGRIEASIQFPVGGYGTWPAFWMLGEDRFNSPSVIWPQVGEIDIVEMFGKGGTTNQEALFTLHWCDETVDPDCVPFPVGYTTNSGKADLGVPLGNAFRVYAAEWDANGVTWSIDGLTYRFTAIQPATMEEFLEEFFIILNVAIGGNPFGGIGTPESAPDDQGWPREMLVDWVRVYQ